MSDEELARIESWAAMIPEIETSWAAAIVQQDVRSLIAEVRRLKAENEDLKHKLYDERAYSSELRKQL